MDISLEEVKTFKRKLNEINLKENRLFIKLFLVLIEHLEKEVNYGTHYFSLLLHNPLNDIPEDDDKKLYKQLITNNSSEIIDLTSIIPSLESNNSEDVLKKINIVFQNAIFTSSNESPLDYEHSDWFNNMSKDVYSKINRMNSLYNESIVSRNDIDYCSKFKSELSSSLPNLKKSKKRKAITSTDEDNENFNKRMKKIMETDSFQEKICEIMNNMNWEDFLKEKMKDLDKHIQEIATNIKSKNCNLTNENIRELINTELNRKFEYLTIERFHNDYMNKIQVLNQQTISLSEMIVKNQIMDSNLQGIRSELNDLRQKTRSAISSSSKKFNDTYLKKTSEIQEKYDLFEKMYSEKITTMQNMYSQENMTRDYATIFNKNQKELTDIKTNYEKYFKGQTDNYKEELNSLQGQIDSLKTELSNKKSSINKIFKEYEKVKNDIKERVNSMTGFVGDFFTKMSAAANGLAITLDD